MNPMKCCVCLKVATDLRRQCHDLTHLICASCLVAYKEFMGKSKDLNCPSLGEDGNICGLVLRDDQDQMDLDALKSEVVPCVAAAFFGCTFAGTLGEMMEHAQNNCAFKHLFACAHTMFRADGKNCGGLFETPMILIKHLKEKHSFPFSSRSELLVKLAFDNSVPHLDEKWTILRRLVIDFNGNQFCMLNVDENSTDVRFWLSEMEPRADDDETDEFEQCFSIIAPFKSEESSGPVLRYNAVVLPYKIGCFLGDDDEFMCHEVEKKCLRRAGDVTKDGKVVFRIMIKFHDA